MQMSEEIKGASVVVPRSILTSILINGTLGLSMTIATLFCIGDIEAAEDTPTEYPFMEIFAQATGSSSGAAVMISIIIVMQLCADVGLLASCSRMLWSFARDRGMPGWAIVARVRSLLAKCLNGSTRGLIVHPAGQPTHIDTNDIDPTHGNH